MRSPKEQLEALPASVRVGPFDFKIELEHVLHSAGESRWGNCSTMEQKIGIQNEMPTAAKATDTFLHEALHAIFWAYGMREEDKEERTVMILSTALLALHRDNPWLGEWIAGAF